MNKTLRFMLVSLLMMLCGTAFAAEVTMKYSGTETANMTGDNDAALVGLDASKWSVVGAKGGNSNFPGLNKAGDFRIYYSDKGSNTITVSSLDGATINHISMTFTGESFSNVKVMVGDNAVEKNNDDLWVINNSSFVLTNGNTSNIQVRIKEVVINYTANTSDNRSATSITLGEHATSGTVGESIDLPTATVCEVTGAPVSNATVTWESTNTDVATIANGKINFVAAGTSTIKASFAGDNTYKPSSASFTLTVNLPSAGTFYSFAELQDAATETCTPLTFVFNGQQVVFVNGSNAFLTDEKGYGVMMYTKDHGLKAGDKLTGSIDCNLVLYQGATEITNFSKEGLAITNEEVTPVEKTIGSLQFANQSTLVTLKDVSYCKLEKDSLFYQGTDSIAFYDKFKTKVTLEENHKYDVTGMLILYSKNNKTYLEICPRSADDVVDLGEAGPTTNTYTVTFVNGARWDNVYAYTFNPVLSGEWPGQPIEKTGTKMIDNVEYDVYTYSLTAEEAPGNIIFNNKQEQTADLEFVDGQEYTYGIPEPGVLNTYTATFTNNLGWNAVYAYAWKGENHFLGEWHGTQLQLDDATGKYLVNIEAEEAPEFIIFNDGGNNQTADLEFVNGKDYENKTVSVTFTTNAGWEKVFAYAWSWINGKIKLATKEWNGDELQANEGVYTYSYTGFETPDSIIFNNGAGVQTESFIFVDGERYEYNTEDALAAAKAELSAYIAEVQALYDKVKDNPNIVGKEEFEAALRAANEALNDPNATVESLNQAKKDLEAALEAAMSANADIDMTDRVDPNGWSSDTGDVEDYPEKGMKQQLLDNTTTTGRVFYQTIEGLENGIYSVKIAGTAFYTQDNNIETSAQADEVGRVIFYANNIAETFGIGFGNQFGDPKVESLENITVSDGKLEIGMLKIAPGTNWHTIQIKKMKKVGAPEQIDVEAAQNAYWQDVAQTILGYEAYNGVTGEPRENLANATTKEAIMAAIPVFYASVPEAENAEITNVELRGTFNSWKTTEATTMIKGDQGNVWTMTLDLSNTSSDQEFKLFINDGGNDADGYAGWLGTNRLTLDTEDGWVVPANDGDGANFKLLNSTTGFKTYTITATWQANPNYAQGWTLKIEGKDQREEITNAEITSVELRGDFSDWGSSTDFTLVKSETADNVWTMTLNLTEMTYDPKFKLVVNGSEWIGNQEMQIDAPDGWVDSAYDKDNNLKILHSITGYNTYTVTATWEPNANANSGWTLKFEGKDQKNPVVLNTYTASFTTNASWSEVYAYAWTTVGETTTEFLGAWPGTPLEKTGDVYTVTIKAEAAPAYIIFNNGGLGAQTADLAFEDGKAYEFKISDEWAAAINAAIAIVDENGIAVGKLIAAIAMAQGQTGTDEDKTALQTAVDQYKADNAPQETDLTSQFSALTNPSKWVNAIGAGTMAYAGWAAPKVHVNGAEVALVESYDQGQEFKLKTGDVMYQDITGLTPGTYGIELFGAACLTEGRAGMTTDFAEGDDNSKIGACLYAQSGEQNVKEYIPCLIESNMNNRGGEEAIPTAKLNGIVVGADGTIRVGLAKELGLTNWHFVQLKGVTAQVLAKDLYAAHQTELQALVAEAQALAADENKTEGKEAFQEALTTAELAVNSQWYNNAEIEGIINNLKTAIANFKKANWYIEFAAGEYYIIDAESGKMMAAGHNYGTRGIVNEMGLDLTLTPYTESRTVSIDSRVSQGGNNHFLGENLYMDSSEWGFALEYQGFGFYILEPNSEKYINIDENDNLVLSETPREFIIVTKDGVMEERMEELADATETNPVDATFLLQNPNFNRNDQRVSAWEWIPSETAEENADNWNNHNFNGGNEVNNCAESYHAAFVVKQTVSGAPAGKYTMTAQGFYRQDTFEGDAPAAPMFFANSVNKDVPALTGSENSMKTASESFTSGLYTIEPVEFEVTEDGMIYVGVTAAVHNQWVIFDNFQLKYYGKKDITDGISVIETEVLNGNVYNLQGQKVTKAQKGLYIVNGRKMIQK